MPPRFDAHVHLAPARDLGRWLLLVVPLAVAVGIACAFFLWSLDFVTRIRFAQPHLLWLLPLAGVGISWLYLKFGASSEGGSNLLLDAIHHSDAEKPDSSPLVPRRMAPLILLTTLITHQFGGSAGREGTALQMGGALASAWGRIFDLKADETRVLLLCGLAAGFGGVFGTPLAGAVFALEVLTVGRLKTDAIFPCFLAAFVANWTVATIGVQHTHYPMAPLAAPRGDWLFAPHLAFKIAVAALFFGLAARLFIVANHRVERFFQTAIPHPLWRPFWGGIVLIALTLLLGTREYLGLGVLREDAGAVTLVSAFQSGGADALSWFWKGLFTVITLGSGFKGGEVTPLFFIGATLGNALAGPLHAPTDLMAGLGLLGVFAGATKTPLACTLLGIELFGAQNAPYFALACFLSLVWSGQSGIYLSQKASDRKLATDEHG